MSVFIFLARFREAPLGWTGWDGIRGRQFILPLHHYIHLGKQTAWRESGGHPPHLTCTQTRTRVWDETDGLIRMHVQYVWCVSFRWDAVMNFCSKDERKEKESNLASLCEPDRYNLRYTRVDHCTLHVGQSSYTLDLSLQRGQIHMGENEFTLILNSILGSIDDVYLEQRLSGTI